ncbi:MAG: tRNA 2-thiouridine(34) synthase MnmA [Kiritimatiellia bacterium]|nr:tRNA 2-thiouridine(34) synthase MnmA [Kiritimatiellia bacterium]
MRSEDLVVLGLSGGVDSAVAALRLRSEGREVVGVTLRMHDLSGCGGDASEAARRVADRVGIRHLVVDCRDGFRREVLLRCWEAYDGGRTPNPCVFCNAKVKFAALAGVADELGAGYIATGHYAQLRGGRIVRGVDERKDQSYFLWALPRAVRERLLFPLGSWIKGGVRAAAREAGLANAEAPESQDVCFSDGTTPFAELLRRTVGGRVREGLFVDDEGRALGPHKGVHLCTIGQRKGLGIALGARARVVSIDACSGRIGLSTNPRATAAVGAVAEGWIWQEAEPGRDVALTAQTRYRQRPIPVASWACSEGRMEVRFAQPADVITPGQSLVLYAGDEVVGGGFVRQGIGAKD